MVERGFEQMFDEIAHVYDSWFETKEGQVVKALEMKALLSMLGDLSGKRLLDVGIGTGIFAEEFRRRGASVVGVDPAPRMLEIARSRGFEVYQAFGEALPFEDNVFDVVVSMTAMENATEPSKFLSEMVRVVMPGGVVVVGVLNLLSAYGIYRKVFRWKAENAIFRNMHFFTYWELKKLMKKALRGVDVISSVFIPPNPSDFFLRRAEKLERCGQRWAKPFGGLLVGRGVKEF